MFPVGKRKEEERELVVRLTPEICYIDLAFPRRRGAEVDRISLWFPPRGSPRRRGTHFGSRDRSRIKEKPASFPHIRHFLPVPQLATIPSENIQTVAARGWIVRVAIKFILSKQSDLPPRGILYLQASPVHRPSFLIVRIPRVAYDVTQGERGASTVANAVQIYREISRQEISRQTTTTLCAPITGAIQSYARNTSRSSSCLVSAFTARLLSLHARK